MRRLALALAVIAIGIGPAGSARVTADAAALDEFERRVLSEPENLRAAAEYRQQAIVDRAYDRAIAVFERLAKRPGAGANAFLNLAFAYVDKVPASGSIRQALLGRDAIRALTRAIAIAPTDLAFYVRGLVNLYYDRALFNRTDKGVADLEKARRMAALEPGVPYMPRILRTLGDGYFRLDQRDKARQTWRDALALEPDGDPLRRRLESSDDQVRQIIARALDADVRVDTSLRELNLPLSRPGGAR
jgi:tetratricopeptide (TPR) repeat protein